MINKNKKFFKYTKKTLIVSCQAVKGEPLCHTKTITLMARACVEGGSTSLRLSQKQHIKAIIKYIKKTRKYIPIIGLIKKNYKNSEVFITPTLKEVKQLIALKVDVIALDATIRKRPKESLEEIVKYIRTKHKDQILMADCSNKKDVLNANKLGFDIISSTLRGYTKETIGKNNVFNNFSFIKWCIENTKAKIILEGGIKDPITAKKALEIKGIHAIVVGSSITRPKFIVEQYINIIKK